MALPEDSSGAKTPAARSTRIASALLPAPCLIFAIAAPETVLSAVTTTRPDVLSTYQAMPSTPDRCTASLTALSWPAPYP
jgi:hypothetical protein